MQRPTPSNSLRVAQAAAGDPYLVSPVAKALAVLARTVRELVALDAASPGREDKANDELSPAAGLRHVAELRKELARRLEVLAAGETDPAAAATPVDGDA